MIERRHAVLLRSRPIGHIEQRGDTSRVVLAERYLADPRREVLGLAFEQEPRRERRSTQRLPAWFSNLLPEGRLREWMAEDAGVHPERELALLLHVGHDLPGGVTVLPDGGAEASRDSRSPAVLASASQPFRFSLAGVALKVSALREGDRFVAPATGEGGDWIVKLPDAHYPGVPVNEFTCMRLAQAAGVDVPEIRLVHREEIDFDLPPQAWPGGEELAYAVRRFDRDRDRSPVHMEDFCQVLERTAERKYRGSYENIARLVYRAGEDERGLIEALRRLVLDVLVGNTDSHLKNWSLLYRDPRRASLSPAYDIVCASAYRQRGEEVKLALKLDGQRRASVVRMGALERLVRKAGADHIDVGPIVLDVATKVRESWEEIFAHPELPEFIRKEVAERVSLGLERLR